MGQQPQLNSGASPWTNPAALADLLDYLRAQGFKITADEYAVAQDLVLALIARGEDINDIATLKTFLAPVLCKSPTQQMNFSAYFDRWRGRIERTEPLAAEREIETAGKRGRLWSWVLAALALVLGTTTVLLWPQPPAPPSPVTHYRYLPEQALRVDPVASLEIFISIALFLGLLFFA